MRAPPTTPRRDGLVRRRSRSRIALFALILSAAALVLPASDVRAQHTPQQHSSDPSASANWLYGTQDENDAYQLLHDSKLITARTHAQSALDRDPDSILGNYVMGVVLQQAEGDLPRAMFRLGNARKLFEDAYGAPPPKSAPWKFHREVLYATEILAGEMEEFEFQVQMLDYWDSLYEPHLTAEHAWPLMQLRRFDDARRAAQMAMQSKDARQVLTGKNALCAVECEARGRQPCFDACNAAHDAAKAELEREAASGNTDTGSSFQTVTAYNAASAAYTVLRFDDVERLAKEGTAGQPVTTANPWRVLGRLYTDEARIAEAVPAMREMQGWRAHEPPSMRDQDHADTDNALATLLLVAGEADAGLLLATRAIERPDRRGLVSSKADQALGGNALLRRALSRVSAERAAEQASALGVFDRAKSFVARTATRVSGWPDDERIASILTDDERLDSTFRINLAGAIDPVPTWLVGDLIEIIGPGVAAVVLERARAEESTLPTAAALAPYYDALEAEVALAGGDDARALRLASRAMAGLPKAEALLFARAAAIGAEAARDSGDDATALRLFEVAMRRDAGVIRRLGLAIPAVVRGSGSDEAVGLAAEMLTRSPRFRVASAGFQVTIDRAGASLHACLRTPSGAELSCADAPQIPPKPAEAPPAASAAPAGSGTPPPAPKPDSPKEWAARLADTFHKNAFSIAVGLSQEDLQSLDGSTTVASQAERDQMKSMLKGMAGGDAP